MTCQKCHRPTSRPRRGLCPSCYEVRRRRGDLSTCPAGHDPWNVKVLANGRKSCRACKRARTLAATPALGRPRKYRRNSAAKLTAQQVRQAYVLYTHGLSLRQLAEQLWCRWGFANVASAKMSLYQAFRRDGLPMRRPGKYPSSGVPGIERG